MQIIHRICSTLNFLINCFKLNHNHFAQLNHKNYGILHSFWTGCSNPTRNSSSIQGRKNYAAAEYLSGGGMLMRGARGWLKNSRKKISQCRKLSHSAKNILFHIHCETILYPCTLHYLIILPPYPLTNLSWNIAKTIPYLNTLPKLYPILIPYRIS